MNNSMYDRALILTREFIYKFKRDRNGEWNRKEVSPLRREKDRKRNVKVHLGNWPFVINENDNDETIGDDDNNDDRVILFRIIFTRESTMRADERCSSLTDFKVDRLSRTLRTILHRLFCLKPIGFISVLTSLFLFRIYSNNTFGIYSHGTKVHMQS